jgi:hypothetical protein
MPDDLEMQLHKILYDRMGVFWCPAIFHNGRQRIARDLAPSLARALRVAAERAWDADDLGFKFSQPEADHFAIQLEDAFITAFKEGA